MRILLADDEITFRDLLGRVIRERTGHELQIVENGTQALEAALGPFRPELLILDWLMPKMTGTQVCRLVRTAQLERQPQILFITGRARREEVLECLSAGGDDLLTKPIAPDVLVARIELANERLLAKSGNSAAMRHALHNAHLEGEGELVVRSGNLCAKVLFSRGKVAWVHLEDGTGSLFDALGQHSPIDARTARAVVEECRITGAGVTDTLVAWGLVDRAKLRELMRQWVEKKLVALCSLPSPMFLFLPAKYSGSVELLFDLDEVLPRTSDPGPESPAVERSPTLIPPGGWATAFSLATAPTPELEALLRDCISGEGVLGAAVIDRASGCCLGRAGQELDPDIVWAQLQTVNAVVRREKLEDCVIVTEQHLHLATLRSPGSNAMICVLVSTRETRLATARLNLKRALAEG
jgi:two-component system, OmpR family, alkaline phosphatase synthesis response regulator PhoP